MKYKYQPKRVEDITDYMSKLIYAYQKTGKIYSALQDVEKTTSDEIAGYVHEMLEYIDNGSGEGNIYQAAFQIIENHYGCSRLVMLHRYLVEVEMHGGLDRETLDMILDDIREWSVRNAEVRTRRNALRLKIIVSVVLAFSTCIAVLYMIPDEYTAMMVEKTIYQAGTAGVMGFLILFYVGASAVLSGSYLDLELDRKTEDDFDRARARLDKWNPKKKAIQAIVIAVIGIAGSVACQILGQYMIMAMVIVITVAFMWQPFHLRSKSEKRVKTGIQKAFPVWMRGVILRLKTDNIYVSISDSMNDAPHALKEELQEMVDGMDENPGSAEPFENFCKGLDVTEIKTSINFLYYLSEFGGSEMKPQLNYLIRQNNHMTVTEEKLRGDDSESFMNMFILAPMLIAMFKLLVDMFTMMQVFTTMFAGVL
jgi:regulator of replication initiation timing